MGFWDKLFKKADDALADAQYEHAKKWQEHAPKSEYTDEFSEYQMLLFCDMVHEVAPHLPPAVVTGGVNLVMTDYDNSLDSEQLLAGVNKSFVPQPGMLSYWAEKKDFDVIEPDKTKLNPEDVKDKYVLTYYPPLTSSWLQRTTDNINDTTNKHWYSHSKSSIYDSNGSNCFTINPEAKFNDQVRDATVYVPEDSISYAIDYKKLGLNKEDIEDGFAYQSRGMNVMEPNMQQSIFKLREIGFSRDEIISLWQTNQINLTDKNNLMTIESHMQNGGKKEDVANLNLTKSDNRYKYNLQDHSCAIQPVAPILFATEAKINREQLSQEQAGTLRNDIGLHNIYDPENYGKINTSLYNEYKRECKKGSELYLRDIYSVKNNWEEFKKNPMQKVASDYAYNFHRGSYAIIKTMRWLPEAASVAYDQCNSELNKIKSKISDLTGIGKNTTRRVPVSTQATTRQAPVSKQDTTRPQGTTQQAPAVNNLTKEQNEALNILVLRGVKQVKEERATQPQQREYNNVGFNVNNYRRLNSLPR